MKRNPLWLFVIGGVCLAIATIIAVIMRETTVAVVCGISCSALFVATGAAIGVCLRSIPANSILYERETYKVLRVFERKARMWSWNLSELEGKGVLVCFEKREIEYSLDMEFRLDSKLVRKFKLDCSCYFGGTPELEIALQRTKAATKQYWEAGLVRFFLLEFQEKFADQIAGLYNPLEQTQSERFGQMFYPFLQKKLSGTGMEIRYGTLRLLT